MERDFRRADALSDAFRDAGKKPETERELDAGSMREIELEPGDGEPLELDLGASSEKPNYGVKEPPREFRGGERRAA